MTKSTIKAIAVMAVSLSAITMFTRCSNPDSVFVGSVETVDMADNVRELKGVQLPDIPIPFPYFAACDSFFITYDPSGIVDFHHRVYSINNGKELGAFVACGHGENEFHSTPRMPSIYIENGDMKTTLFGPNERKIFVWNISQSLDSGQTVLDKVRKYDNYIENGRTFNTLLELGDGEYAALVQSYSTQIDNEPVPHHYAIVDAESLKSKDRVDIVKKGIYNKKSEIMPEDFFSGFVQSNKKTRKIVEAMYWLGQINIIDIASREVKSYRISQSDGPEIFETPMTDAVRHYLDVACDDDAIYALWKGKKHKEEGFAEWIHKYDWNGNMVERLHLDRQIFSMWLDEATGTLYGYSPDDDRVYAYSLGQ